MFRALLNHSRAIRRNSSFITVMIDHINDAVEGLKAPKRKTYQTTPTVRKLSLWIDLVEIYVKNNHAVGSANILKLQRCTDHLSTCKERMEQNQEEFSTISGELGEIKFLGLRRFFSESKQLRIELLEDNKYDLEVEKRDLVSMVRIKEKLEGIVGSLSVERN
uniref:WGS project CBMI000000000 data, contig CS3069_c003639 n=1 Tax=Fusarium clavum TaxID=2594811 RepID=A0A090MI54_9HYPO|nr:unnamed protein product [Fusarium clavum]CEG05913.1 unnamed protein product [Fusarium clavum]